MNKQTLVFAALAFLTPLIAVAAMNYDSIAKMYEVDPSVGKLVYYRACRG